MQFLLRYGILKENESRCISNGRNEGYPNWCGGFQRTRTKKYYFVDKTMMIKDLLEKQAKVSLFTRPRRFGKTLNMSMIQRFFEKTEESNACLFENLNITKAGQKYMEHQGQYSVISISLKSMKQTTYELAYETFKDIVKDEFRRHKAVVYGSDILDAEEKRRYDAFLNINASESAYNKAIEFLSKCLERAYNKKVIILIDEYDVPPP